MSWEDKARSWRAMPIGSSISFFAGVFCLFAAQVLVGAGMSSQSQPVAEMMGGILIGGGFAIGWAYAGTRKLLWWLFLLGPLEGVAFSVLNSLSSPHTMLAGLELEHKLNRNGCAEIALIIAGYVLFIIFFNQEGARFFRTQTEVRLAGEIHRALVPARHQTIGKMELFGTSIPSSEVGGDLFDIVESNGRWHAYVADVAGHGVAAGILMSMIKSTASMQLQKLNKPEELLMDLNDVMQPLKSSANYLTFAYVGGVHGGSAGGGNDAESLDFALAGHLPILHYRAETKTLIEHSDDNVPIGLFKNQRFATSKLSLLPGDLLAVITDGFTEVFDSRERELGMGEFKSMLLGCAERPLPEIYRGLRAATLKFGKQSDDQTMLLIRRLG